MKVRTPGSGAGRGGACGWPLAGSQAAQAASGAAAGLSCRSWGAERLAGEGVLARKPARLARGRRADSARAGTHSAWRGGPGARRRRRPPGAPAAAPAGTCQRALRKTVTTIPLALTAGIAVLLRFVRAEQGGQLGELGGRQMLCLHQAQDQALSRAVEHA